jgi:phosphoglycolate phosphatase
MTLVFDLDGTLIDSAADLAASSSELVESYGAEPLGTPDVIAMVGEGAAMLVRRALSARGLDPDTPGALDRFLAIYDRRLLDRTRPYAGIAEALACLVRYGALTVVTNKPLRPTTTVLEALGLRGFFSEIVGGDGVFPRKPDPTGLLALATQYGRPAMMVGDSPTDYDTAKAAGATPVIARYGFGIGKFGPRLPDDAAVIDHPRELVGLVETITLDAARMPIVMR